MVMMQLLPHQNPLPTPSSLIPATMVQNTLITAEDAKNSAFDSILHGSSNNAKGGLRAMVGKDTDANSAAIKQYFQHWDDKRVEDETDEVRQARTDDYASLTRQ